MSTTPGNTVQTPRGAIVLSHADLGRLGYRQAYERQLAEHERIMRAREDGADEAGVILAVEHPPVITVPPREIASEHVLASADHLRSLGVACEPTNRGGDVTYHGPGQIVLYPIVDLSRLGIKLHAYLRILEQSIIDTLAGFGLEGVRDQSATGVWLPHDGEPHRKIAAIGIRVRRWVTLHGLALNVRPDLGHFQLIVPCGLHGRPVTSMHAELSDRCPSVGDVRTALVENLRRGLLGG